MNKFTKKFINSFLFLVTSVVIALNFAGCTSKKPFDGLAPDETQVGTTNYSGKIVVTSVATDPSTGPGLITMFNADGTFYATVRDLYPSLEWSSSTVFVAPDKILALIGNADRIEQMNLTTSLTTIFTTTRINGTVNRNLAIDPADGSIYMAEQIATTSTIEKYNSNGNTMGAPFINSTVGSCVTNTPTGMTVITTTGNLAAVQSNRLNIFSSTGTCLATVTAAPFSSNAPYSLAYHSQTDKLLVGFSTNSVIYACNTSGASCVSVYNNPSIVSNPRSIAVSSSGAIFVGSAGTDTIEKFTWTGSGQMIRSSTTPFIGPAISTQNPTSIMVIP